MQNPFQTLPLNPLRAFAIAARHKSFTAAAAHMGVTQVAISRQVRLLEDYLDVTLFERGARSAKLTDQGRALAQEIAPLFDQIEAATRSVLNRERDQTITLRIYPTLAHYMLMPRLARFQAACPGLEVRFDTTVEPLDFRGTHLDVAVQLGQGPWKDARARSLFPERLDLVCSPAYAARIRAGDTDLCLLQARYRRRAWADWQAASGITPPVAREVEFTSSQLTYGAALHGMGFAIGQIDILGEEIAAGRLVTPFNTASPTGAEVQVIWPRTKSPTTPTRRFIDWLLQDCGQAPEFFPGA